MKKFLFIFLILLSFASFSYAGPMIFGSGTGDVATDTIFDAAGDLVQGTGANTAAKLTKGAEGTILRAGAASNAYTTMTYPATGTAYALPVITATNVLGELALGTTGKLLMGATGAVPVWTTPTFPNAATTTGAYLRADGTNFIQSTLVLPNSATAGDIFYATGANTMGSLAKNAGTAILGTSGGTLGYYTSISQDDSAAQFYSATASKGTRKFVQSSISDTMLLTDTPVITGNVTWTNDSQGAGTYYRAFKDGALGTPSFTALNMPTSNADPGTTAGQIKHDSTDTLSNSGGTAKWYDGAQVRNLVDTGTNYTIITKTEFLPIGWAVDGATAPSAIAAVTGKEVNARSFTEADDVVFWWIVPLDYVGGIKYRVIYALTANASADDTAVFSMTGSIVANSGDLDGSAGTALTATDELTTDDDQYQVMISDYTAESNADWSLVAGGLARLNFSHAAASDMAGAGEPLVIGIEIKYKSKIAGFGDY